MCGIFGVATAAGGRVGLSDQQAERLRDLLAHRGPDGAGLWRDARDQFLLAHRRLAVVDLSPQGAQPMAMRDADGRERWVIAYNGELYNDAELREDLGREGVAFRTRSDTETVLAALGTWGLAGVERLRGMYAIAAVDVVRRRLVLARDPLGIKPLHYWVGPADNGGIQVVFASEPRAVVAHPDIGARPDLVAASAYLTTIRTTLGERTLFEGVRTLLPGEVMTFDLGDGPSAGSVERLRIGVGAAVLPRGGDFRAALQDSVARHLRADVPVCSLLSGGLDSSVVVTLAARLGGGRPVRTYASGHDDGSSDGDLAHARAVSAHLGTVHTEAPVDRAMFRERWPEMIARRGMPLSTPNEVAINEVARRLRADGQVVALSGEGADELLAGYELPMRQAWDFEVERRSRGAATHAPGGGQFQMRSNAWIAPEAKALVFRPEVWRGVEQDATLATWYEETFAAIRADVEAREGDVAGGDEDATLTRGVQAHLEFHQRVNLAGLLARLDTATMLEGVEGRTPFADVGVARAANALPMSQKYDRASGATKIALRRAFAADLPAAVVSRPKASFPLPFQEWVVDHAPVLQRSQLARMLFTDAAIESVCADPGRVWNLAWPMINLALWGEAVWG